jgi:hypothetical protein
VVSATNPPQSLISVFYYDNELLNTDYERNLFKCSGATGGTHTEKQIQDIKKTLFLIKMC